MKQLATAKELDRLYNEMVAAKATYRDALRHNSKMATPLLTEYIKAVGAYQQALYDSEREGDTCS